MKSIDLKPFDLKSIDFKSNGFKLCYWSSLVYCLSLSIMKHTDENSFSPRWRALFTLVKRPFHLSGKTSSPG